jgi:hypothetical protein
MKRQPVKCHAKNRKGEPCGRYCAPGKTVCKSHGADGGRPVVHALYSRSVPDDWLDSYEYFKSDPDYLSLRSEIALSQTNMDRFLALCEGQAFNATMREHLMAHVEHIGKLKEKEAKRIYQESVVSELLARQVQAEAAILQRVLTQYVDPATAERAAAEFANLVGEASGVEASVSL